MFFRVLTIFLLSSSVVFANDLSDIDSLAKPIIKSIENNEVDSIVSKALSHPSVADYISKSDMSETNKQFQNVLNSYGKFYSLKILHEQGVEDIYWSRWYIIRFERAPMLIKMEFYKPHNEWRINSIAIDADLDEYIEKSGKYNIGNIGEK
ncbi:MAG: hypothetical protein GY787_04700 [Alteromonadales bacterium]|nr:hypothetical protein [Alteromonadales bacterium]